MIDGRLPAPSIKADVILARRDRCRLRAFRGRRGAAPFEPAGDRARRLGANADRQRRRPRRPYAGRPALATRRSGPRRISPGPPPKTRAESAPRGARSAAGGASSPARRGSSTPMGAFRRMGPRRSWSSLTRRTTAVPARRRACRLPVAERARIAGQRTPVTLRRSIPPNCQPLGAGQQPPRSLLSRSAFRCNLGVWSRSLMEHSCRAIRGMRYGPGSSWERHNDSGGPSSDTA
jgi:hypothetical protein